MKLRTYFREFKSITKNSNLTFSEKNSLRNKAWTKFLHATGNHKLANATAVSGGAAVAIQRIFDIRLMNKSVGSLFDSKKRDQELTQKVMSITQIVDKTGYSPLRAAVVQDIMEGLNSWKSGDLQDKSEFISTKVMEVALAAEGGLALSRGSAAVKNATSTVAKESQTFVTIGMIEDDVMIFSSKVGNQTIEGISNFIVKGNELHLNQLHLQGGTAGSVGRETIWKMAKDLGKQFKVEEVVIQGGKRTTGKYKGKIPSPIRIKVN